VDTIVTANGALFSGCEVSSSGFCAKTPFADPPSPRKDFAAVFSRSAGGVYVVGGVNPVSGSPLSDVWFQPLPQGTWRNLSFDGEQLGRVRAATFSFRGRQLWVLDQKSGRTRLLRLDPMTSTSTVFASWPSRGTATKWFLALDRDGSILVSATSPAPAISVTARVALDRPIPAITLVHVEKGELRGALLVDSHAYAFVVNGPGGTLRIRRHETLTNHRRSEGLEMLENIAGLEALARPDNDDGDPRR